MQHHSTTMNHGDMDMGEDSCSMNMLFTWNYKNTCVVFRWWHIKRLSDLLLSFLAIMILGYLYEYMRYYIHKSLANRGSQTTNIDRRRNKLYNSCLYGLQVGYSFMLMLVFMTYNGWLMIAVVLGAIWGHYSWGSHVKTLAEDIPAMACH